MVPVNPTVDLNQLQPYTLETLHLTSCTETHYEDNSKTFCAMKFICNSRAYTLNNTDVRSKADLRAGSRKRLFFFVSVFCLEIHKNTPPSRIAPIFVSFPCFSRENVPNSQQKNR